jgi:D-3-phosphoglycerate dehydrogenase
MRILVAERIAREGLELLAAKHTVDERLGLDRAALRAAIEPCEGLLVRSQVQVDAELTAAGRRLRVIGRAGSGSTTSTSRRPTGPDRRGQRAGREHDRGRRAHAWPAPRRRPPHPAADARPAPGNGPGRSSGHPAGGKTPGVIGLGRIGLAVAQRAQGFGMRVLASDPYVSRELAEHHGVELVSLADVISQSDVVTLHVPLSGETTNLLNRAAIDQLKPGAIVLNVARGGVVDEAALADALRDGRVAGAGVDVFEHEPPSESPLLAVPNVVLSPHIAASTAEAQVAVGVEVAQRILEVLDGMPVDAVAAS